jgi:GxxExxY protein
MSEPIPKCTDEVAKAIVDSALTVHRELGTGLLESVYEACLAYELGNRGLSVQRQVHYPVVYQGERLEAGLRIDLLVDDCVVVELKAVEKSIPLFEAQLLTYLKLSGKRLGLLINFNVTLIKNGIKRLAL